MNQSNSKGRDVENLEAIGTTLSVQIVVISAQIYNWMNELVKNILTVVTVTCSFLYRTPWAM